MILEDSFAGEKFIQLWQWSEFVELFYTVEGKDSLPLSKIETIEISFWAKKRGEFVSSESTKTLHYLPLPLVCKENELYFNQNSECNFRVGYYLGCGLSHFLMCSNSLLWNVVSASQMEELIFTTFQEMLSIACQYCLAVIQEDPTVHTRS